jgi:hypothetical protein
MNLGKIQDRDRKTAGPRSGRKLERGSRLAQHCTRDKFDSLSFQVPCTFLEISIGLAKSERDNPSFYISLDSLDRPKIEQNTRNNKRNKIKLQFALAGGSPGG